MAEWLARSQWLAEALGPLGWNERLVGSILRFLIVLGFALVVAVFGVSLLRRALIDSRDPHAPSRRKEAWDAVLRTVRGVVLMIGLYEAAKALPLHDRWDTLVEGIVYVLAVYFGARALQRAANLGLQEYLERTAEPEARERVRREYLPVVSVVLTVGAVLFGVILVAHHFNQDVTSLVAFFGVGSAAIGLAAQPTIGNTLAGFLLLIDRPVRPGDRVKLQSGETGEVRGIGVRSTQLLTEGGDLLIVPNGEILNSRVLNLSLPTELSRGELKLKVAIAALSDVEKLLLDVAAADAGVERGAPDAVAPEVAVTAIEGKCVEVALRFSARASRKVEITERLRREVASRLLPDQLL